MERQQTLQSLADLYARRRDAAHLHAFWADRLGSKSCRNTVRAIGLLHGAGSTELRRCLEPLGYSLCQWTMQPRFAARLQALLTKVRGDRAIMRHLEASQLKLIRAYLEALAQPSSKPVKPLLERHLANELRHLAWLSHRGAEVEGGLKQARRRPATERPPDPWRHPEHLGQRARRRETEPATAMGAPEQA